MNVMSESKGEWSARLVGIITPLVISGIHSIFKEACALCEENDEGSKYLMTFQNFLARIPKWNNKIIMDETNRIITDSQCNYLEDMLTCVHITKLKMLTSIRVSDKQKKIDIDIPKLSDFVHNVYCRLARKLYSNIYLFEKNIQPLQYQKNMRECEILVRESVLEVIRDNMPVEQILRAYIDQTVTEEVIEEIVEKNIEEIEADKLKRSEEQEDDVDTTTITVAKSDITVPVPVPLSDKSDVNLLPEIDEVAVVDTSVVDTSVVDTSVVDTPVVDTSTVVASTVNRIVNEAVKTNLTFNDNDSVLDMGTNRESVVNAPKTPERLTQIETERNIQRKLEEAEYDDEEEEEDERLVIKNNEHVDLKSDVLGIETLTPLNSNSELLLGDIDLM